MYSMSAPPTGARNLMVLGRAMERVVARHPELSLVLAGPRRGAEAPPADAPWVHTIGFVSDDELVALYRKRFGARDAFFI